MKTKSVTQLDEFGYFLGTSIAYESPLEPGVFHIPANAIDVKPPTVPANKRARWVDGMWQYEDMPVIPDIKPAPIPEKTKSQQAQAILDENMFFTNNYYWNRFTSFEKQEFTDWFDKLHEISANPEYAGDVPLKPLFMLPLDDLTPEELAQREKLQLQAQAHDLLERTNRFETSSFQAKYWSEEQEAEFEQWRHNLLDVLYEGCPEISGIPDFVQQALEGNMQPPLLQSVTAPEPKPKKRKTKSTTTE